MPPTIQIRLGQLGTSLCNASATSDGPCVISVQLTNLTLDDESDDGLGLTAAQQDGHGAMRFIIAVLLVYSLMGTAGMLILRIRQSATRANSSKNVAAKEAHHYLKHRVKIYEDCHRARLVKETNKVLHRIQSLEHQRSLTESLEPSNNNDKGDSSSPLLPANTDQGSTKSNISKQSQSTPQMNISLPPTAENSPPSHLWSRLSYLGQSSLKLPLKHTDGNPELSPQTPLSFPVQLPSLHSLTSLPLVQDSTLNPPHCLATPTCSTSTMSTSSNITASTSTVTPTVTTVAIVEGGGLLDSTQLKPTLSKNSKP